MQVSTNQKRQVIDITDEVAKALPDGSGLVNVFVEHTTAAVTTADLDPGTDLDFLDFLSAITPSVDWRHPHDPAHAPDHMLAALIGPSLTVPVTGGKLKLGSWQRIIFVELDGPRDRELELTFVPSS